MAEEKPLYTLYKNLKAQNYDVPDDYSKFENALTRDGKAGADNRHAIYDNLKAQNYDVPDKYESFYTALFEPRSKDSSRAKGGSTAMSAADKAKFVAGSNAIVADSQKRVNNFGRYANLKQRKQKQKNDFGRVTIGSNKTPFGGDADNVVKDDNTYDFETGKIGTYVTSDENETGNEIYAQANQAALDEQSDALQKAVGAGEMPSVFDVRDKDGNYDLQENIGKNGTYLTEVGVQNQLDKKLADAYARKREIEDAIAEDNKKNGNPLLSYSAAIGAGNGRDAASSDYRNKLATSLALVQQQIGALEAVKQYPTSSIGEDMWKALDNTAFTAKTWDFGLTDFAVMGQMERIKAKIDNNIALDKQDKMLLNSKLGADAAAALEDEKLGNTYRWTKIAGQSLPFMLDFVMTGGYGGVTKWAGKKALTFAAKREMGKLSTAILKYTGVTAGNIVGSYAMAGTEQAMKTSANIMQRHLGTLYQDEDGNYGFGTFDENGNLVHEGGESAGEAIYKGLTSAMIENYTEKFFHHTHFKRFLGQKMAGTRIGNWLSKVGTKGWYANSKQIMRRFGIDGLGEEIMEEEIGIPLNALLVGDNSISDLADAKQQLNIIGGMALSVGGMAFTTGGGMAMVKGTYNRAQYYRFKHKVNTADQQALQLLGEDYWPELRDRMDNTTNEDMSGMLYSILGNSKMSKEQRNAAIMYGVNLMKMRGYNLASTMQQEARKNTGEPVSPEEEREQEIDNAYAEGHDAEGVATHSIQLEQNESRAYLAELLGISEEKLLNMSDDELEARLGESDQLDTAIYDYQASTARYQGVIDNANDKVDMAAHLAALQVDQRTDISRGTVRTASVKATQGAKGYEVFIISGNLSTHEDGTIDISGSDQMILYFDPKTGRKENADPSRFASVGEEQSADEVKNQAVMEAKDKVIREQAGIIDGKVEEGSSFTITDADGTEHTYEVLADNGDGTAMITLDGNVEYDPYSLNELQQLKDAEDQKKLIAARQQREELEAQRQQQKQNKQKQDEAKRTRVSQTISEITDDNGKVVIAAVDGEEDQESFVVGEYDNKQSGKKKYKVVTLNTDGSVSSSRLVDASKVTIIDTMPAEEYGQTLYSAQSTEIEENGGIDTTQNEELPPSPENATINGDGTNTEEVQDKEGSQQEESKPSTLSYTLSDGTPVPMREDGNPDTTQMTAVQTAEFYDTQFGEDAEGLISGWVSDAKKALDAANKMTVKGKDFVEQKASKDAKTKAIADAQAKYDSAQAIADAYKERILAKQESSAEGRRSLLGKAKAKYNRLKGKAEEVHALWNETVGAVLHRLYDSTGVDVFDTTPQTIEEYVSSSIAPFSLNYEGSENGKGVKQETGLERQDFANSHILAAEGKGQTVDAFVHKLWEARPAQFESATDQDIRAALLDLISSDMNAYEMRHVIERNRIAEAERAIEAETNARESASYEEHTAAVEEEKTPAEAEETEGETPVGNTDDASEGLPFTPTDESEAPFSVKDGARVEIEPNPQDRIESERVEDANVVDAIVGKKTRKALERIANMMGAKVQWQYTDNTGNGWYDPKTNTIYLALDSSIIEGVQFIFGHEMTHEIKENNPAAYEELKNLVKVMMGEESFERQTEATEEKYKDARIIYHEGRPAYEEEVVADQIGTWLNDADYIQTLALKMSHPLLAMLHDIVNRIKMAFRGTEYTDNARHILRTIEQAYEDTAIQEALNTAGQEGEGGQRMSLRTKPAPKKTEKVYKLMRLGEDGKLYPLFIGSAEAVELGMWYDADSPALKDLKSLSSKDYVGKRTVEVDGEKMQEEYNYGAYIVSNETGEAMSLADFKIAHKGDSRFSRIQNNPNAAALNWATENGYRWIKIEEKKRGQNRYGGENRSYYNYGINGTGAVGIFAMRPGWHAGSLPTMRQIGKGKGKNLRDDTFVWVEGEIPADIDYNEEAQKNADKDIPDHIPTDGFYLKATNANKEASQAGKVGWYVAGAFLPKRIMSDKETRDIIDEWNKNHPDDEPVEYDWKRESGKDFDAETMSLEETQKYSLRTDTQKNAEMQMDADEVYSGNADVPTQDEIGEGLAEELKDYSPQAVPWNRGVLYDGNDSPVKYSAKSAIVGVSLKPEIDADGKLKILDPLGRKFDKNNPITAEDLKRTDSVLNAMVNICTANGTLHNADIIYDKYAEFLNRMLEKGDKGFGYVTEQWMWEGEALYRSVHNNGDAQYAKSIDITRICKKNEAVIHTISELQKRQGYGVTVAQILDIYNQTIQDGYQAPCPVCYVFSRYLRNGVFASTLVAGQRKYGSMLVDPKTLSEQEKKKRVAYWVNELDKLQKFYEENKKAIAQAKQDIQTIFEQVDDIAKDITGGKLKGKELKEAKRKIEELDARYRAAIDLVSVSDLTGYIKAMAIEKKKDQWQLRTDSWKLYPEDVALDITRAQEAIVEYPGVQRYRNSHGSAAGKSIQTASNNDLGDTMIALGLGNPEQRDKRTKRLVHQNILLKAFADETTNKQRATLLNSAKTDIKKATVYAAQQLLRGGIRQWSWSDNVERLSPDVFLNLMQVSMLGGALQAYSKQLEGVELVAAMGGYVNGSLMGKGRGYKEVNKDYKDAPVYYNSQDGKYYTLEFDNVVGIEPFSHDGKLGLFDLNQMYDRAGNILVGMDDIHIRAAMADPRVFFIIPWHASGMTNHILNQFYNYLGVDTKGLNAQDYTKTQEEKKYGADDNIPQEVTDYWESHNYEDKYKSGIGIIPSGKGKLSAQQIHYRELKEAMLLHNTLILKKPKSQVRSKKDTADYDFWTGHKDWLDEIQNDEFLSLGLAKVQDTVNVLGESMTKGDTEYIYPYEYWDINSTVDNADVNGERYVEYCRRLGMRPKFSGITNDGVADFGGFSEDPGYWKLLIDRRMYDRNGKFQDLTPVTVDGFEADMVDPEKTKERFDVTRVAELDKISELVDHVQAMEQERGIVPEVNYEQPIDKAVKKYNGTKFSLKDKSEGWKQANKKAIHIAEAIERDPKFSLKRLDGTLIKAGTYFSGGGLVEEGLKGVIDPVVAVEYDEKISGVYRNNFGQHLVTADVRDVDPKELVKNIDGEVEFFHASPVCKNFSQAKANHEEVELDKETAQSTADFIGQIKPAVVTIENVKGYRDSEAMKIITDALDANGYKWDADVYNAADYGGYTNRERLIVRAVKNGELPPKPEKQAHKSGWFEAVEDIIPTLTEKKNGVAPWMDIRLQADGIDWRNIDKPLYVMGSAYADGKIPHAFADELLPTLRTKSGDVIVMPGGKVYRAMGRVLARVSGMSDDYQLPHSESLAHTIIGNGIPTQLTENVIAPLLMRENPKLSFKKDTDGNDDIRYSLAGERGAANMDKAEEVTTRMDNLNVARQMEKVNKDAKTIKIATGWERGADGKWRYEIPDFTIKEPSTWLNKRALKISDVIEGNDIFKAYPEAKDIKFKKGRSGAGGWYNDGVIEAGLGGLRDAIKYNMTDLIDYFKVNLGRTLLHEVQHYIQHEEGFALGGNSGMVIDPGYKEEMQKLSEEEDQIIAQYKALPVSERRTYSTMSARAAELYRKYEDVGARINAVRKKAKLGKDGYHRLAGEVEARNVEKRSKMTDEERKNSLVAETEDVKRENQIFYGVEDKEQKYSLKNAKEDRIQKLRESKPIEISGKEITPSDDLKQYKKNAKEYGKTLQGTYTNEDTGVKVQLQRGRRNGGVNEVLQHDYKDIPHLQSVAAIPQIIRKSIYIDSEENTDKEKNPAVSEYQYFVCGLKIGGTDYTVRSVFAVDNKGNRYYDHKLTDIGKGKLLDLIDQGVNDSSFDATSSTKPTTANNSVGKDKKLFHILQANHSELAENSTSEQKYSLRVDRFRHDLDEWKKANNLPKDAQRPYVPVREPGETAADFMNRVKEYRKEMALWKTAPTYEGHLLTDDTAQGEFNRELQRGSVLARIALQDSMLAIRKAQEAIMKEHGIDRINIAEDAYSAENRSHGKGKNEFEEYNDEFLQPLRKAYNALMKKLGKSYDNVKVYMIAKHGLERNAHMAFQKALEADYDEQSDRIDAYNAYNADIDRLFNDTDYQSGQIDFTTWRLRDNAIRTKYAPSYLEYRYDKMGITQDYSGLSALFDGSDFEEAAADLVKDVETNHPDETAILWYATNDATKKILRDSYKAGMMTKQVYEYVKDMYRNYIPLRGWGDTNADQVWNYVGGGKGAFNQTLKEAHGRKSLADDPIAYIENMAESGILLNNKNWVKQHLLLLAQNNPTSLLNVSKAWYVKSTDAQGNEIWIPASPQITPGMTAQQVEMALEAFENQMEQKKQNGEATQKREHLEITYPQTNGEEREHEVRVMKDGEEYVVYINGDPQLAQAINNTRATRVRQGMESSKVDRLCAAIGRYMASVYTSLSPLFIPSNFMRDFTMTLASTAIREDGRYNYLLRKNMATHWNTFHLVLEYQNGNLREKVRNGNATKTEQMFYDYMMNGGETGFVSSLDVEDVKKKFKNELKDLNRSYANPKKVGHLIMESIETLNRAIEDSNRFMVYMTSIQYGRSIEEAVNNAKDVTLNFNRKGTGEHGWQTFRNLYLFINPAVQSLQTLGALAKHHPFKFTAVTTAWLASGMLVPLVNNMLISMFGDDDDKDKYWSFRKWDRRNNFIMWVPFTKEFVKIPLAQEFRGFYAVGDIIASKMWGGEKAEQSWTEYAEDMMGQVIDMLPLDPTGYDGNIAVSLMPNAIRPMFELAFNVDYTGKPLFKESEFNKYDPNYTKAYVGTPEWLVKISKAVNSIGNDYPDVQQNAIDKFGDPRYNLNNPAVVDHVLSSYLGGAYTLASQTLGVATKLLNEQDVKVADVPFLSKFVSNPNDRPVSKKQGDEFWNTMERHDRAANILSKLKKKAKVDGDYSTLEDFYKSDQYKQYKTDDKEVKKYQEDRKKEKAEEAGEEYKAHKKNYSDVYKEHATAEDDYEDLLVSQIYQKVRTYKATWESMADMASGQANAYYEAHVAAIEAAEEAKDIIDEITYIKKGFLDEGGKETYSVTDMKEIRKLRKQVLPILIKANKMLVQKAGK